jgi:glycosyltransferase involved in cell wall biosynthesis
MIAPAVVQRAEEEQQASAWRSWPPTSEFVDVDFVHAMEARTWVAAHHVTCPSEYVRDGLLQAHVPANKISVIPYPIDTRSYPFVDRRDRRGPPTIGFVGSVALRKGAPAFIEVARRFDPKQARFVMVGPVATEIAQKARQASSVELVGAVPRGEVRHWLERFDVFFFPSTCEGSAGAVREAMATGLPVVTTPNSGSVVRNGIEGFLVRCNDVDAFEGCLAQLIGDPACRVHMGRAARRQASNFDLDWYSRQLRALFDRLLETQAVTCNQGLE